MSGDWYILGCVFLFGFVYYKYSTIKIKFAKKIAFLIKMTLLILSFFLAFSNQEYILEGNGFAFGGRSAVMLLTMLEIVDAVVDRKNNK